ncbi:MAG TPA: asparagine synthase-related protein [Acidimicrobiales bacterium]|nr:asparagine synthase-related protein [Acidimicrobiales bacterium]
MTPTATARGELYRMNALETAAGWVTGRGRVPVDVPTDAPPDPVAALESALLPALQRPPCVVQFSGGRDSSLVLAAALRVARRHGLPDPVALTRRFPGVEEANEEQWQEDVARHLSLREWERVAVYDELDVIGPVAGPSLERHGLLWPPLLHQRVFDLWRAGGGSMVDGEGGDEVFRPGRLAPLGALARGRRVSLRAAALAVAPRRARQVALRRLYRSQVRLPWLRPDAWARVERALAADHAAEPADWRRALLRHPNDPGVARFVDNYAALGAEHGVVVVHPLLDPGVLAAVGAAGGRTGFADRSSTMVALFGELLPPAVLHRDSKAGFNAVAFNRHSRAFVAQWRGEGVDDAMVDVDALRATWMSSRPHGLSLGLLQAAWLAARPSASAR